MKDLNSLLTSPEFINASSAEKVGMVSDAFTSVGQLATDDAQQEKLFKARTDVINNIHLQDYWSEIRNALPSDMRTAENQKAFHQDIMEFYEASRSDPSFNPKRFNPSAVIPLSEGQVSEIAQKIKDGGEVPPLMPSELGKVNAKLAEIGGGNFVQEALIKRMLETGNEEGPMNLSKGGAPYTGQEFANKARPALEKLEQARKNQLESQLTEWRDISDKDGVIFKMRRKPDVTGIKWQMTTPKGIVEKEFTKDPTDEDLNAMVRENIPMWETGESADFHETVLHYVAEAMASPVIAIEDAVYGGKPKTIKDRILTSRVERLVGGNTRSFTDEADKIITDSLLVPLVQAVSGAANITDWIVRASNPGGVSNTLPTWLSRQADQFSESAKIMRSMFPETNDQRVLGNWSSKTAPYHIAEMSADAASLVAQMFAAPEVGIPLIASTMTGSAYGSIKDRLVSGGMSEEDAAGRAGAFAPISGLTSAALMSITGRLLPEGSVGAKAVEDAILRKISEKAENGILGVGIRAATSYPKDFMHTVVPMEAARLASETVEELAMGKGHDETTLNIMQKFVEGTPDSLTSDALFAGFASLSKSFQPEAKEDTVFFSGAPEKFKVLSFGGEGHIPTERGVLRFPDETQAGEFSAVLNSADSAFDSLTQVVDGKRAWRPDADPDAINQYKELRDKIDRNIESNLAWSRGRTVEHAVSSHDSLIDAVDALKVLANKLSPNSPELASSRDTRQAQVEALMDHMTEGARDWEAERSNFIKALERGDLQTKGYQTIQDKMDELEARSRDTSLTTDELDVIRKAWNALRSRREKAVYRSQKPTDVAADEWVASQKEAVRESFRDKAETQIDQSFDPLAVEDATDEQSKAIKQMLTIEPRHETGIGPDGVRWSRTRYDVILGDRGRADIGMARRLRFADPFHDPGVAFHPILPGSDLIGNLGGLTTEFDAKRRSYVPEKNAEDTASIMDYLINRDEGLNQSPIGAEGLRQRLLALEQAGSEPFKVDFDEVSKPYAEPEPSPAKSAAESANVIDSQLTEDERTMQSPRGAELLKKKLTLERMNAARESRREGDKISAAEATAAEAAGFETHTPKSAEESAQAINDALAKDEALRQSPQGKELLNRKLKIERMNAARKPLNERITDAVAQQTGAKTEEAAKAVAEADPEKIKTSARKVIKRGSAKNHGQQVEASMLPEVPKQAETAQEESAYSQPTKDAINVQKGTSLPVWLSESNKLRPFTQSDVEAIAKDLGLEPDNIAGIQKLLHSKYAKSKPTAPVIAYGDTPEMFLERGRKDAVDKIIDGENGTVVDDFGNGITQREFGGETFWRDENVDASKPINPNYAKNVRKNQRGSTIIFGEIADLAVAAIKKGLGYASFLKDAIAKFGERFTEAFKRTWVAVARGTADVASANVERTMERQKPQVDRLAALEKFGVKSDSKLFESIMRGSGASEEQINRVAAVRNEIARMESGSQLTDAELNVLASNIEGLGVASKWLPRYWMQPIHKALRDIHPALQKAMLKYAFDEMTMLQDFTSRTKGFHDELRKLTADEARQFTYLTRRNDGAGLQKLLANKPALVREWKAWKDTHAPYIRAVAAANGLKVGLIENYFPTSLKEGMKPGTQSSYVDAFHDYLRGTDAYDPVTEAVKKKESSLGRKLTAEETVDVASAVLGRSGGTKQGVPGNAKERRIKDYTEDMLDYYKSPADALTDYVNRMPRGIAQKRFFGVDPQTWVKGVDVGEHEAIPKASVMGSIIADLGARKLITPEQGRHVKTMIQSLTQYKPTPAIIKAINAGNPFFALNNPVTAIKMLGHAVPSLWENGFWNTAIAITGELGRVVGLDTNKLRFEDLGLPKTLDLLTGDSLLKPMRDFVWSANLFKALDGFAGNITVNGWLNKMKRMTEAERVDYIRQYSPFLKASPESISESIMKGDFNNDVHFLAFNNLSQIRPTSMASLPRGYVENPSARLAYNLRIYMVHSADYWRDASMGEIQRGIKQGNRGMIANGIKGAFALGALLTASGASFTMVSNYILGKPGDWEDSLIDSFIHNISGGMMSEYTFSQLSGKSGKITDILTAPLTSSPASEFIDAVGNSGKQIATNVKNGEDWWRDALKMRDFGRFVPVPWVNVLAKRHYWQTSDASNDAKIKYAKGLYESKANNLSSRLTYLNGLKAEDFNRKPELREEREKLKLWGLIKSRADAIIKVNIETDKEHGMQNAFDIAHHVNLAAADSSIWDRELNFLNSQLEPVKLKRYEAKHR